jgi:membrane protein
MAVTIRTGRGEGSLIGRRMRAGMSLGLWMIDATGLFHFFGTSLLAQKPLQHADHHDHAGRADENEPNSPQEGVDGGHPSKSPKEKISSRRSFSFVRQLLRAVWKEVWEDDCIDLAAQTSFYFILAIFPFFIILAALVSYLPFTHVWHDVVLWIIHYFPPSSRDLVIQTIFDLTRGRSSFLSFGVAAAAWAASTGIMSMIDALDTAYEVKETRSYWRRRGLALGMLLVLCLFFLIGFGLLTAGGGLGDWIDARFHPGPYFHVLWHTANWVVSIVLLVLGMAFVERVLPNARRSWRWVTVGAIFVVGTSIPASLALRFYVRHFTTYATAYGTLGAFFVLMLWIYMESLIILVGAELNSELEKLRARQTTALDQGCG